MATAETIHKPSSSAIVRDDFGGQQIQTIRETAATAVAAREKAAVEARYLMALKRPRSIMKCREELIKACGIPTFADVAWYMRPAGRKFNKQTNQWEESYAEGFSIRFAEEALRSFGNVYPEMSVVFEDEETRIVRDTVTDLESNLSYSTEIVIRKRVERRKLKDGQEAVEERVNSEGKKVYIVEATDDEVLQKQSALRSKAMRTDGLRLIPAWLKEECKELIFKTRDGVFKEDPDRAKRKLADAFNSLGVSVQDLEAYLGHGLERLTNSEYKELVGIGTAIKDGDTTWGEVMAERNPSGTKEGAQKVAEEKLRKAHQEKDEAEQKTDADEKPESSRKDDGPKQQQRGFSGFGKGSK